MSGTEDDIRRVLGAQASKVGGNSAVEVGELLDAVATRRRRRRHLSVGAAMLAVVGAGLGFGAVATQSDPERLRLAAEDSSSTLATAVATTTTTAQPPTDGAVDGEPLVTADPPAPVTTARPAVPLPTTTVGTPARRCDGDEDIAEVAVSPSGRLWATLGHDSLATSDDGGDTWTVRCDVFVVDGIGADAMGLVASSDRMAWAWLGTSAAQPFVRTTDGGASWHRVGLPPQEPWNVSGASFAGDSGWVWGSEFSDEIPPDSPCPTPHDRCSPYISTPYLYRTSDAGRTWEKATLPEGMRSISSAGSVSGGGGWIVDSWHADPTKNSVHRTTDDGRTWTRVALPETATMVLDLSVWSGSIASVAANGSDGHLKVSTTMDGGSTWATSPALGSGVPRVVMTDASTVVASGRWGQLWQSTDSGTTWTSTRSGDPNGVSDLAANRQGHVAAADFGLLVSSDRGRSWKRTAVT